MRYRNYKIFAQGGYYHVYNRGVGQIDIFLDDQDRKFFLYRLKEYLFPLKGLFRGGPSEEVLQGGTSIVEESHTPYIRTVLPAGSFSLFSYCLMLNHFHLLIRQNTGLEIRKLLAKLCTSYSKYFNKKYERVGALFQDAFKAVRVESDPQLLWLSSYIHNNPRTAGIIKDIKDYPWSSYPDYTGLRKGTLCDKEFIIKMVGSAQAYTQFVDESFLKIKERKDLQTLFLE